MKAIVVGELIISGNIKLVFGGRHNTTLWVGRDDDWQQLKYVKGFRLTQPAGGEYAQLDIEVSVLNAEGEILATQRLA